MIDKQKKTMVKYMHIVEQIKENIAKGILVPQDLLPSENELMAEFGVSSITVRKAMETMVQQGIVYRVKGKGTYVADPQSGQENANGYKKVFLIFDVEAALDASLTKIVQGIQQYYQNKKSQLVLEKYAFCEEYLRDGKCKKEEDLGWFSAKYAGTLCSECKNDENIIRLDESALYTMQYIITSSIEKLYTFQVSEAVLQTLERILKSYLAIYVDRKFKSLKVLEEIRR